MAAVVGALVMLPATAQGAAPLGLKTVRLSGAAGGTEPRVTTDPQDDLYTITNSSRAVVYRSTDHGASWSLVPGVPAGQSSPTIDVDIVATRTGRLVASELDFVPGPSFKTSYSDDGGKTWTQSIGSDLADQDREFLAVGPDDPTSHQPRVYLLFHNLASGAASHNMYVSTSTDGGATFGEPVPVTLPPSQAWLDLQCADSGGPSNIVVDQHTGQIYVFWGTRSSVAGGCGASATGTFEINVVGSTRVWVATSADGSPGSWTDSLAVDDSASGKIVGMQEGPGAVDSAGNVYVFYPESINPYPDYDGAAMKYVWARPGLMQWSPPVTVAPAGGAGHILPHVIAGDPGKLDFAYYTGQAGGGGQILWYTTVAQTLDGLSAHPHITEQRVSSIAAYSGTASELMGACGSGPAAGVENGFACGRSTDVWGIGLDLKCNLIISWPVANGRPSGTYSTVQDSGPRVCTSSGQRFSAGPRSAEAEFALIGRQLYLAR